MTDPALDLAVIGAGPVGLALALHAARMLPTARVTLFDRRELEKDVSADPRTLALSLGSVQILERLGAWRAELAEPILEVHVSQAPPGAPAVLGRWLGEPELRIRAADEGLPQLGAVLSYGAIVAPLQAAWLAAQQQAPERLHSRFGTSVDGLKNLGDGVEVDAGIAERFDLAVIAEGGVFAPPAVREPAVPDGADETEKTAPMRVSEATRNGAPSAAATAPRLAASSGRGPMRRDYRQTAWVGQVTFEGDTPARSRGVAIERFTRHGPAALLPLRDGRAALIWCVRSDDDPVRELDDRQRVAVLNTIFHPSAGRIASVTALKPFPLGLHAERTLAEGRTVRIGNAAQTLHPVAGQGLNLGLRDAFELVRALGRERDLGTVLRRLERQRARDRWSMIFATDFLARSFTWQLPGAGAARGLGIAALQALGPAKSAIARQMMFGSR